VALPRVLVVGQGKGGVGKTSLTANVAGLAAAAGHRVLAIDLDQQANLARDLGYEADDGEQLLDALEGKSPLPVLANVRPRLDVVRGGPAVGDAPGRALLRAARTGGDLADGLHCALEPVVGNYDIVLLDTPPGERALVEAALAVATYLVIPTRADDASIDGLELLAQRFAAARDRNPDLRLLGVALFAVNARSKRLTEATRASITELLGGVAPVFTARIRHMESAAVDARRQGLLIHELEPVAARAAKSRLAALRAKTRPTDELLVRDVSGLAADYAALAAEILTRVTELETAPVSA
jgi:chromosome partitioning protein